MRLMLTKWCDQRTYQAVGCDDGKNAQHPGILTTKLEVPQNGLKGKERKRFINDALNTFYLWLYGIE